jgi:hypothetical protein
MYESSSSIFNILTTIRAFQLVDKVSFHWLLTYLRPSLLDNEIPHRTKLCTEILERASTVEGHVKERLQVSLVSFLMPACAHTMTLHSHDDRIHLVKSPLRSIHGLREQVTLTSQSLLTMFILQANSCTNGPSKLSSLHSLPLKGTTAR